MSTSHTDAKLERLERLMQTLVAGLDTLELLSRAFYATVDESAGERGALYLLAEDTFHVAELAGVAKDAAEAVLKPGDTPVEVLQHGDVRVGNFESDPESDVLFIPLRGSEQTFGVMAVQPASGVFSDEDELKFWKRVGNHIGAAAERARLFDIVQRSRARFRNLIDTANAVIVALDRDGRFTHINDTAESLTGYTREELTGKPFEELVAHNRVEDARRLWQRLWAADKSISFEFSIESKSGEELLLNWSTADDLDLKEQKIGVVLAGQDITRQKQLEQSLHQSEKLAALGTMVSGIAHELNNPLTAVIGYSELLSQDESVGDAARREIQVIHQQGQRCREVVDGLLHFARKDMGARFGVEVNKLIQECLKLCEYHFHLDNVSIDLELADDLPPIIGDPSQLKTALLNVMNNAHDAMAASSGGRLCIGTRNLEGLNIQITIEDSGGGISSPERVFEPFFTTKEVGKGTGLGLSATYGIVSEHGGSIRADNTDAGALFTIVLPVASVIALDVDGLGSGVSDSRAEFEQVDRTVLVIDDESAITNLLCRVLESRGYRVRFANSVDDAMPDLEKVDFDVIVTDVRMPGRMNGESLYDWLKEHRHALSERVAFISGDLVSEHVRSFVADSGRPVLAKPFTLDEFLNVVDGIAAERSG